MSEIIRLTNRPSYERKIPTNLEEALLELDRRFMIESKESNGSVKARVVFRELLEDYTQGLNNSSSYHLLRR